MQMIWIETPTNPLMKLVDIAAVCTIAHQYPGVFVVVDNTFMSSYFQVIHTFTVCCATDNFINIAGKVLVLKIESFRKFATIFKILTKMKISENMVYVISQLIFFLGQGISSGRRRNIARSFTKTFGKILGKFIVDFIEMLNVYIIYFSVRWTSGQISRFTHSLNT